MKDTDPRPMPPQVLAAYREPLDLKELLASDVFTEGNRFAVREELLDRLTTRHGNVEVEIGKGSKTLSIRKRIAQFKKNDWGGIEIILSAEEFGGRDSVLLELASVMQPYWARWWESMDWNCYGSICEYFRISSTVIGHRQMVWLGAQYARTALSLARTSDRQVCLDAIEATEALAVVPSENNRYLAAQAAAAANFAAYSTTAADYALRASASAYFVAYHAADARSADHGDEADDGGVAVCGVTAADYAAYAVQEGVAYTTSRSKLCSLTKKLITPTLITRAYRGLR